MINIKENILLAPYTTFRIGGPARYFFEAESKEDLILALEWAEGKKLPYFILGGGSNLLVSDKGFEGIVIKIKNKKFYPERSRETKIKNMSLQDISRRETNQNEKIIECDAGVILANLIRISLEESLTGLEWAAGIPGTVGGAIRGNAGAYGGCMGDIIDAVEVLNFDSKNQKSKIKNQKLGIRKFSNKDCDFGYRNSIFKRNPNLIIISAEIKLGERDKNASMEKIKEFLKARVGRHPIEPSAGCVFKNIEIANLHKFGTDIHELIPEDKIKYGKIPVAYLIEQCGLKGKKIGGAMISGKHANYIVNLGNAKADDVKELINSAKEKVMEKFGIKLEEEIHIL